MPTVSVILPVYNGLPYLKQSITSVLLQTFSDFELLIINDGSTDGSGQVVNMFEDPRIRIFHQKNRGLAATLNWAISISKGKYIARQDQDDVCMPERLQKQVDFLESNPEIGVVGTAAEIWMGSVRTNRTLAHPTADAEIRFNMLFDNYFVHSSIMLRRGIIDIVGGYTEDRSRQPPEDYELWSRVMHICKLANLPDVLMIYREVPGSMSREGVNPFQKNLIRICAENIAWATDSVVDAPEVMALSKLMHWDNNFLLGGVRFDAMNSLLQKAMLKIAGTSKTAPEQLMQSLRKRERKLFYHYADYKCGGLLGKVFNGRAGRYGKSLAIKLLSRRH